jgi:hypothetical protein
MAENSAGETARLEEPVEAEWTKRLGATKFGRLNASINHPKAETLRILKALGLPKYRALLLRANDIS